MLLGITPILKAPRVPGDYDIYTWGLGTSGRTGQGVTTATSSPVNIGAGSYTYDKIAYGVATGAAITTVGALWMWGINTSGMLGDLTTIAKSSPIQVGAATNWAHVSVGLAHTAAINTDGELFTWGSGGQGRTGHGDVAGRSSPVQVGLLQDWAFVTAGENNTHAIKTDGTLWAWGDDSRDSLGDGTGINKSSPVQIGTDTNWLQVASSKNGGDFTMAVKTNGKLYSWGDGNNGRTAQGGTTYSTPTQVGSATNWLQVTCGKEQGAAVKSNGQLWSWGRNNKGPLGDGTTTQRTTPVQVGLQEDWLEVRMGASSTTDVHTGGIRGDGATNTLYMWGTGANGCLGDGTTANKSSPVQIGLLTTWKALFLGDRCSGALLD